MHLAINCSFCSNLLGEYVTLGAWERLDIRAIVAYLWFLLTSKSWV